MYLCIIEVRRGIHRNSGPHARDGLSEQTWFTQSALTFNFFLIRTRFNRECSQQGEGCWSSFAVWNRAELPFSVWGTKLINFLAHLICLLALSPLVLFPLSSPMSTLISRFLLSSVCLVPKLMVCFLLLTVASKSADICLLIQGSLLPHWKKYFFESTIPSPWTV